MPNPPRRLVRRAALGLGAGLVLAALPAAQSALLLGAVGRVPRVVCTQETRVVDPKLEGGLAAFAFELLPAGAHAPAFAEVLRDGHSVAALWSGPLDAGVPCKVSWDGRDRLGRRVPTGSYRVRLALQGGVGLELPLDVVRLGVTAIEAQGGQENEEFQLVYFLKGSEYAFYATPAIHEYVNTARPGEVSELDLDDGEPRPVPGVHLGTASPVLDGGVYATAAYNYPLAYVRGASPRIEVVLGTTGTQVSGAAMGAGYPIEGCSLRLVCDQALARPRLTAVSPGTRVAFTLAPLPDDVGRTDREITLRWQYRGARDAGWRPVPGHLTIPLRFYTLLGPPLFKAGASGAQYSGPWVEVLEDVATWKQTLGLPTNDVASLTRLFVQGFFGQNGGLPTAIEGVVYDAFPLGGDGGANHYYNEGTKSMRLARLLNGHASGRFVNCSDNMGATTTMLSMLGVPGMRPVRLGFMSLRALWGIGSPGYTLDLWGGSHAFSYHHIVTDDEGVTVSDTCMQLDGDGSPTTLPASVAWNFHRPWSGPGGYMDLAANNVVTKRLENLPGVQ